MLVGIDRSGRQEESLVEIWSRDIRRASDRLVFNWNEIRFGTTKVRDEDDRIIADCTTIESADAARRLLTNP